MRLNVLPQNGKRRTACTSGEVARCPKRALPIAHRNIRPFLAQQTARRAIEGVDHRCNRDLRWILDNQIVPNQVGLGFIDELRSYLEGLDNRKLAETLLGGLSIYDFPESHGGAALKVKRGLGG